MINDTVSKIAFYSVNKLRGLMRVYKDLSNQLAKKCGLEKCGKIVCMDCEASCGANKSAIKDTDFRRS